MHIYIKHDIRRNTIILICKRIKQYRHTDATLSIKKRIQRKIIVSMTILIIYIQYQKMRKGKTKMKKTMSNIQIYNEDCFLTMNHMPIGQ